MNSSLKQVAAVIKLSAIFRHSAWRSNKTLSKFNAGLGGESFNPPQAILHNEDEGKDSHVGTDESSMLAAETCNPSWSELAANMRAERINRPQIAFSDDDEDDSFVGLDEGSMAVDETYISSWSEEVAKLRAAKTSRPKIIVSDDDEGENNIVSMDESAMAMDEIHTSSSSAVDEAHVPSSSSVDESHICSSSSFSEKYSKLKRPSSVRWTDVEGNADRVSIIGSIGSLFKFKWSDSGQRYVCWTSIDVWDENFSISDRFQLYFLNELAYIAKQHLKLGDFVHVSGKLEQIQNKIWIKTEDVKFVQQSVTRNKDDLKIGRQYVTRKIWHGKFGRG